MIRFMLVMVPLVFLINGLTKDDWLEAFLFAVAVAVGLTPEMLPMIVTVNLAKGALAMSRKKVIVKRLNAIQNFGAMDVLCTDKTGTLTQDKVILERHRRHPRRGIRRACCEYAYLNSHLPDGPEEPARRRRARARRGPRGTRKSTRAIARSTRSRSTSCAGGCRWWWREQDGPAHPDLQGRGRGNVRRLHRVRAATARSCALDERHLRRAARGRRQALNDDGFRVLAVAYKEIDAAQAELLAWPTRAISMLVGYVAFLDPPKESARRGDRARWQEHGVAVKVLTGDNELVTRKICREVGLAGRRRRCSAARSTQMSDAELGDARRAHHGLRQAVAGAEGSGSSARCTASGHVVGFLGDGINDAPGAAQAADVGISVDTAVDIAKESADIILLEKSLMVLEEGVIEGRKVFGNIIKYIKMGASSNFGNMFSVLGASAFLPFLPMAPIQILTNNLLYDFSQTPIPTDNVDEEYLRKPRQWDIGNIGRFMLFIGPISSIFDYVTFVMMLYVLRRAGHNPTLFQTGWFVESLLTQTLIVHVIRTARSRSCRAARAGR